MEAVFEPALSSSLDASKMPTAGTVGIPKVSAAEAQCFRLRRVQAKTVSP
jgi:hypothetical protein